MPNIKMGNIIVRATIEFVSNIVHGLGYVGLIGVDMLRVVFESESSSLCLPYNVRGTTYCNL
jgi:hypothetical protein